MKHIFKNREKAILRKQVKLGVELLFGHKDRAVIYDILRFRYDGAVVTIAPRPLNIDVSLIRPSTEETLINQDLLQYSLREGIDRMLCAYLELTDEQRARQCFGRNCGWDYFLDPDPLAITFNWSCSVEEGRSQLIHCMKPQSLYGGCGELGQRYYRFIYSVMYVAALTPWLDETGVQQIWLRKLEENELLEDDSLIQTDLRIMVDILKEALL